MIEECNRDVLRLEHDPPEELAQCMCQCESEASLLYLGLRDIFSFYHFGILVAAIILVALDRSLKIYIFFDFWTQALLFITSEFAFYGVVRLLSETLDGCDDFYWTCVPWYCKIYWALFSAALPSSILSAIVFWAEMFSKKVHIIHTIMNVLTPIMAVLEFVVVAFPLRVLHSIFFIIFYTIYILFTYGYQKMGGTGIDGSVPIYRDLDWRQTDKAILTTFVGLIIGLVIYFIFCGISRLKFKLKHRNEYY